MELVFLWDANKARVNLRKHKVSFDEAKSIFNDPLQLTFPDEQHSDVEDRHISIGISSRGKVLLVVHTEKNETENILVIRIISCRKATASERRIYEESEY